MTQKPYHSEKLDEIREKIDALDTRIHETLMERAELVLQIGEEKRKNNIEVVQPAREARMIRRLLDRHEGALPEMAVVRIWRELVGAVSLLQTGLKVVVAEVDGHPEYWDEAKDYFGSCLPMERIFSPLAAIKAVREGRATFAVVPYPYDGPDNEDDNPWWEHLDTGSEGAMNIIVRLPHGDDPNNKNPASRSVVVAKMGFDGSDDDHSFIFIECDPSHSRGKIVSTAEEAGLKPTSLSSKRVTNDSLSRRHLLEVEGYWQDDMDEIKKLKEKLGDDAQVFCTGGYPVPPTYSKTIMAQSMAIPPAPKEAKAK
jgi:chorismate mutase